jgi:hypothetical protein
MILDLTVPYDAEAWYCDCNGVVHYLKEHDPIDVALENSGSYNQVHLLGPENGGPGRLVLDSYVLHPRTENPEDILK